MFGASCLQASNRPNFGDVGRGTADASRTEASSSMPGSMNRMRHRVWLSGSACTSLNLMSSSRSGRSLARTFCSVSNMLFQSIPKSREPMFVLRESHGIQQKPQQRFDSDTDNAHSGDRHHTGVRRPGPEQVHPRSHQRRLPVRCSRPWARWSVDWSFVSRHVKSRPLRHVTGGGTGPANTASRPVINRFCVKHLVRFGVTSFALLFADASKGCHSPDGPSRAVVRMAAGRSLRTLLGDRERFLQGAGFQSDSLYRRKNQRWSRPPTAVGGLGQSRSGASHGSSDTRAELSFQEGRLARPPSRLIASSTPLVLSGRQTVLGGRTCCTACQGGFLEPSPAVLGLVRNHQCRRRWSPDCSPCAARPECPDAIETHGYPAPI